MVEHTIREGDEFVDAENEQRLWVVEVAEESVTVEDKHDEQTVFSMRPGQFITSGRFERITPVAPGRYA